MSKDFDSVTPPPHIYRSCAYFVKELFFSFLKNERFFSTQKTSFARAEYFSK